MLDTQPATAEPTRRVGRLDDVATGTATVPPTVPVAEPAGPAATRPAHRAVERTDTVPSYPGAALVQRAERLNQGMAPGLLRAALAVVFVWFGALKLTGTSPVKDLLAATLPFVDADISVPVLGGIEVLIGLVVAAGVLPRISLLVLTGHLAGTFLTFVTASDLMWQAGHPLALTADGEFVAKNVVLIGAALVLIGRHSRRAAGQRIG